MTEVNRHKRKKDYEVKNFTVPFALGELKENMTITTSRSSKESKEQIINKAIKFHLQGNIIEAEKYYQYCLKKGFNDHRIFSNYGIILKGLGKLQEAETSIRNAIKVNPNDADPHSNLGIILKDLGKLKEAEISIRKAIKLKPNFAILHYNLGLILKDRGKLEEAELSLRKVIEINPDSADAYYNLGKILKGLGKLQEAKQSFETSLELDPKAIHRVSNLLTVLSLLYLWDEVEKYSHYLNLIGIEGKGITPLGLMYYEDNPLNHLKRAAKYTKENRKEALPNIYHKKTKKINIGYFSSDFRNHPITHLLTRVLELHDQSKFSIYAYSLNSINDNYTKRVKDAVFCYREIHNLSDHEIVRIARNDQIDIAIDLNGYTKNNRMSIFSYRVAPIQINYLGYTGSLGSESYDYILSDKIIIPEKNKKFYTEKVLYLPNSSFPYDNTREILNNKYSREQLGLPSDGFVFACFNNIQKITRKEFKIWMRLLQKVEGSVLWLIKPDNVSIKNFYSELNNYDIDKERIVFAEKCKLDDHLSRHYCADLFLDTFNFNAATTAMWALSCGLPLITKLGNSFSARMAASILNACNLNELVTNNSSEYESLAYKLATNKEQLSYIRDKLIHKKDLPFFDSYKFTNELESIYTNLITTNYI